MARPFSDQLVFITGAASGIGRATALKLATQGAYLALFDISPSIGEIAAECRDLSGHELQYAILDIADYEACKRVLVEACGARKVHHVFNCAGINPTELELTETANGYFDRLLDVNVKGTYYVTKLMVPHMVAPGGSFVNVGSICGLHPQERMALYCATKYAVTGFSKSMALELGPKGIRVNVVAPGFVNTPTNSSVLAGPEMMEKSSRRVALGRMGTPEEVADAVIYLMSDAARYCNGTVLEVNGGTG